MAAAKKSAPKKAAAKKVKEPVTVDAAPAEEPMAPAAEEAAAEAPKVNMRVQVVPAPAIEMSSNLSIAKLIDVAKSLEPFTAIANEIEAMSKRAVIDSQEKFDKGSNFLSLCAAKYNQIEAYRKSIKKPIDDYAKLVQSVFMPILDKIDTAKSLVSTQMTDWQRNERKRIEAEQAEIRRKQEEEAQRLADEERKKGNETTAAAIEQAAAAAPVSAPVKLGTTNDFGQKFNTRETWKASVVDKKLVLGAILRGTLPLDLVDFPLAELNKFAREQKVERVIEGIKVYKEETGVLR